MATHSNSIVVSLQSKLASMSSDFKQVLDIRTENLKKQQSRRQQFSSAAPLSSPASTPSLLVADDEAAQAARSQDTAIDMGGGKLRCSSGSHNSAVTIRLGWARPDPTRIFDI